MNQPCKLYIRFTSAFIVFSFVLLTAAATLFADVNVFTDSNGFSRWTVVGPAGGDARTVTIDPKDPNRLYISTLDGQIHTSADAGRSWRLLVNLERPQMIVDDLLVDLNDSNVLYATGHRGNMSGGFFKSTDRGLTWKEAKELRNEAIHAMTQADNEPGRLFVGTTKGVWTSADSGETWTRIQSDSMPINVNSLAVDPADTSIIYAGTQWRPYKSTDDGKSWNLIKTGMIDDSDVFAITINPENRNHVIASACSGIYESFNGGERWNKIQGIPSQSRRTRDIVQHPTNKATLYAGTTEGFWMSVNGGKAWSMTTQRNLEVNSIAVHPDKPERVFIATNNYGVMVSNDGGRNFAMTNDNFTSRFTYSITPDAERAGRLYATTHNTATSGGYFFISNDGGSTWNAARGLDTNRVAPYSVLQDSADANRIFLGTNMGVYRSLDRGESWTLLTPPPARRLTVAQRRAAAAAEAKRKAAGEPETISALTGTVRVLKHAQEESIGIVAGTDDGLFSSTDPTKGWQKIELGEGINPNIFVIHTTPALPGTVYVGTMNSGVLVSRDLGKTWTTIDVAPRGIPITAITIDPKRPNNIYVGTIQSLYLSRDGGRSWTRRGGGLPLGKYTSILVNPDNSDEIFTASSLETDGGVFYSSDAGERWTRVDQGMPVPSRRVWAMAFDPNDPNRIFAASHSSGVYRIDRIADRAADDR